MTDTRVYDADQVDRYVAELHDQMGALKSEIAALREEVALSAVTTRDEAAERALGRALIQAQYAADRAADDATRESERILEDAYRQYREILEQAQHEHDRIVNEAMRQRGGRSQTSNGGGSSIPRITAAGPEFFPPPSGSPVFPYNGQQNPA